MSGKIHPTAVVDPAAELGPEVEIGPYVTIEGPVVLGRGCVVRAHASLIGPMTLGEGNEVGHGAVLGAPPQHLGWKEGMGGRVEIGSRNRIRELATIHRGHGEGGVTRVGDNNYLMAGSHLGHDSRLGDGAIIANNALLGGHVEIGDGCFLGGGSVYHQFVRIGERAIVQGLGGLGMDLPPFCIAAGVNRVAGINVVGLRRAGFSPAVRTEIRDAYRLLYRSGHNVSQAVERAAARPWGPEANRFWDFVRAAGKRGICPHAKRGAAEEPK